MAATSVNVEQIKEDLCKMVEVSEALQRNVSSDANVPLEHSVGVHKESPDVWSFARFAINVVTDVKDENSLREIMAFCVSHGKKSHGAIVAAAVVADGSGLGDDLWRCIDFCFGVKNVEGMISVGKSYLVQSCQKTHPRVTTAVEKMSQKLLRNSFRADGRLSRLNLELCALMASASRMEMVRPNMELAELDFRERVTYVCERLPTENAIFALNSMRVGNMSSEDMYEYVAEYIALGCRVGMGRVLQNAATFRLIAPLKTILKRFQERGTQQELDNYAIEYMAILTETYWLDLFYRLAKKRYITALMDWSTFGDPADIMPATVETDDERPVSNTKIVILNDDNGKQPAEMCENNLYSIENVEFDVSHFWAIDDTAWGRSEYLEDFRSKIFACTSTVVGVRLISAQDVDFAKLYDIYDPRCPLSNLLSCDGKQ